MKALLLIICLFFINITYTQRVMSWNIQYLGKSKFLKDTIVPQIAKVMSDSKCDIIAIQELVINKYGDSCIIQLANELNFNYVISNKTTGDGTERYAFLYHKAITLNYAYLDTTLQDLINREPYVASFKYKCNDIIIRQIHVVPKSKNPQNEINYLTKYNDGIICGDFNLNTKHILYNKFFK
jgi:endonuclease/exonuclease/phosphatase family metal-dependent hydrolase